MDNKYSIHEAQYYFETKFPDFKEMKFDWGEIRPQIKRSGDYYFASGNRASLESFSLHLSVRIDERVDWRVASNLSRGVLKLSSLTEDKLVKKIEKIDKGATEAVEIYRRERKKREDAFETAKELVGEMFTDLRVEKNHKGGYDAISNIDGRTIFTFRISDGEMSMIQLIKQIPVDRLSRVITLIS